MSQHHKHICKPECVPERKQQVHWLTFLDHPNVVQNKKNKSSHGWKDCAACFRKFQASVRGWIMNGPKKLERWTKSGTEFCGWSLVPGHIGTGFSWNFRRNVDQVNRFWSWSPMPLTDGTWVLNISRRFVLELVGGFEHVSCFHTLGIFVPTVMYFSEWFKPPNRVGHYMKAHVFASRWFRDPEQK